MPPEGVELLHHNDVLRNEEFIELISYFIEMGITKIRFTGGEALVRKGFIDILEETRRRFPDIELCLTTNGVRLAQYLDDLYRLGVKKLNISLDTLDKDRFIEITGKDHLADVLAAIDKALEYDYFNIKVNSVLLKEAIDEIEDIISYFSQRNIVLRFIEKMPFSDLIEDDFIPAVELIDKLLTIGSMKRDESLDTEVSLMYNFTSSLGNLRLGIIPPVSHKFCSSCNRLRLTSDGILKTCLHSDQEADLKTSLREKNGKEYIENIIMKAVMEKGKEHNISCDIEEGGCHSLTAVKMSRVGG